MSTPNTNSSEKKASQSGPDSSDTSAQSLHNKRRNRRQGFTPKRRGRPRRTYSGGSR